MSQPVDVTKTHIHKYHISNISLVRLRMVLLSVMLAMHLYLIAHIGTRWFSSSIIFLSNWGFWTTNCYFIIILLKFPDRQVTKNYAAFFHTLISMEFVITIVFWTVLYPDPHYDKRDKTIQAVAIHGIPLTCLLIDFCFNRFFVCKRSFKHLLIVGCSYSIFNMILVLFVFGKPIYPPLTWKDWNSVIFSILSITLQLLAWTAVLVMQKVKYRKVSSGENSLIDVI
jgi:hypothetical protein